MTMPMDLFSPAEEPSNPQSASAEWTQVLQDPKVRASMLSMGLQLMQPPSFGQTGAGQIAQAVGAGGETLSNIDTEERAERELSRKERDTSSQIDYRADTTDVKQGALANQEQRTLQAGKDLESRQQLRAAQAQVALANVGKVQAQIEALQTKTLLFPQDQQAKIDLARAKQTLVEAQAGLAGARTEAVTAVAPSQVERNRSQTDLNRAREGSVTANADVARSRVDLGKDRLGLQERIAAQRATAQERRDYITEKNVYDKNLYLQPKNKQQPFMSFEQWQARNKPPAAGATPPAPTTAPDSQLPSMPTKKEELKTGTRYMTPRGPATWDGTKFVE